MAAVQLETSMAVKTNVTAAGSVPGIQHDVALAGQVARFSVVGI